ncbi:MAG: hypothetical protein P8M62_01630 [Opitutae bacterium]|nr:hypothetical protein [Opitutae bacterium]MDG2344736.1 hypothetical protein [Opitutae bacterium]
MGEFDTTGVWEQFADSPAALAYLEARFKDEASLQHVLLEEADDSHFAVQQWVEALIVLQQWLGARGLELPVKDSIGYVSCAAAAAGAGASLSHLPSMVDDLLEAYGCDRAVKK